MKVINGFLKWLALLAICLAAGLAAIIYFSARPDLDEFWLRIIILLAVAFIGSLACRLFFHRLPGFILFLIALLSEVMALLVIDYFYDGTYRLSFLTRNFTFAMPIPSDAAQFILILLVALPTLFFLRRRRKPARIQAQSAPAPAPQPIQSIQPQVSLSERVQPVINTINPANWQVTRDVGKQVKKITKTAKKAVAAKPVRISAAHPAAKSVKAAAPAKAAVMKTPPVKKAAARKTKTAQNNDVKLMGEEEHVCPYCLEKVNKNDRKMICPECGTWHHQDCWDLTGACGVAHRNEL